MKRKWSFPFIEVLEIYPDGLKWDYIHYKNETHNSLGFKSICAGFEMIYKNCKTDGYDKSIKGNKHSKNN